MWLHVLMQVLMQVLVRVCGGFGLGTLLGPEGTPAGAGVFLVPSPAWSSNASCAPVWGSGCGGGGGFGVWLCVECCIVDASILLWSSV